MLPVFVAFLLVILFSSLRSIVSSCSLTYLGSISWLCIMLLLPHLHWDTSTGLIWIVQQKSAWMCSMLWFLLCLVPFPSGDFTSPVNCIGQPSTGEAEVLVSEIAKRGSLMFPQCFSRILIPLFTFVWILVFSLRRDRFQSTRVIACRAYNSITVIIILLLTIIAATTKSAVISNCANWTGSRWSFVSWSSPPIVRILLVMQHNWLSHHGFGLRCCCSVSGTVKE